MRMNPYLTFDGQCEAALRRYAEILGGTIEVMMSHRGTPAEGHVPPESLDRIMHGRITLGDDLLMGSDALPGQYKKPEGFSVSLQIKDPAEAERVFHALAEGGEVQMPIQETFWAARFGMLVDRFGIPWMVNCEPNS